MNVDDALFRLICFGRIEKLSYNVSMSRPHFSVPGFLARCRVDQATRIARGRFSRFDFWGVPSDAKYFILRFVNSSRRQHDCFEFRIFLVRFVAPNHRRITATTIDSAPTGAVARSQSAATWLLAASTSGSAAALFTFRAFLPQLA